MQILITIVDVYLKLAYIIAASCVALMGTVWLYIFFLLTVDFALHRSLKTKRLFKVFLEVMWQTRPNKAKIK